DMHPWVVNGAVCGVVVLALFLDITKLEAIAGVEDAEAITHLGTVRDNRVLNVLTRLSGDRNDADVVNVLQTLNSRAVVRIDGRSADVFLVADRRKVVVAPGHGVHPSELGMEILKGQAQHPGDIPAGKVGEPDQL